MEQDQILVASFHQTVFVSILAVPLKMVHDHGTSHYQEKQKHQLGTLTCWSPGQQGAVRGCLQACLVFKVILFSVCWLQKPFKVYEGSFRPREGSCFHRASQSQSLRIGNSQEVLGSVAPCPSWLFMFILFHLLRATG